VDDEGAKAALLDVVRREPGLFGHTQSRWTLTSLLRTCDWLKLDTLGGVSQLLDRLGIHLKRARTYLHSPDPDYVGKLALIGQCLLRTWCDPQRYVFLYLDEFTYYRQPTLASAYEAQGHVQPLAHFSYKSNTAWRVVGALNALTGQVTWQQHKTIGLAQLSRFYDTLQATYPEVREIYVVQDNWPIHFHPDILAHLQPQTWQYPLHRPAHWKTQARSTVVQANWPIRLLPLPTYASWLNPIEKLWRWLKQEILHLHRSSDDWPGLKQRVAAFLNQFLHGCDALLRYVGLLPD